MSYVSSLKRPTSNKLAAGVSLGSALLAGLMAAPLQAAENPENGDVTLSTVQVEANENAKVPFFQDQLGGNKFTAPISSTPKTVQIIDSSLFQQQHATNLTEALRNSPGVGTFFVGENGNTTTGDSIYMRGFDTSNSIFVDGVRDMGSISRDTFNTEQVEIIKGPDGSAYGRSAASGSINMVTKKAKLDNSAELHLSAGSADQKRTTVDVNQTIGATSAVRLNAMWQDSGVPGRDEVTNKRWGVAPAVSFGLGTDTRVHLNYLHIQQNNVPDGGVLTLGLPGYTNPDNPAAPNFRHELDNPAKVNSKNFYGTDADYDDVTADMLTALVEKDFANGVRLFNTTRWGQTKQEYLLSAFMASGRNATGGEGSFNTPDINDPSTWQANHMVNTKDYENSIITNQTGITQLVNAAGMEHNLSYGLELTREKVTTYGVKRITVPQLNIYNPSHVGSYKLERNGANAEGKTDTVALYLFDTIKVTDALQLNAGLRFDHYKTEYENTVACVASGRGTLCLPGQTPGTLVPSVNDSTSGNLFTWQLGALYQFTDAINAYASYSVAAQPPGGNALTLSTGDNSADNKKYDPQESRTAELGTKWKLVDDKLLLSAAIYRTTVVNLVEQDPTDSQYYQTGEKQVQGIELAAVGQITDNWNVSAGYSIQHAKVTKGKNVAKDGSDDLAYNPGSAFTSWTSYSLPFGLTVGGGVRYVEGMKRGTDGAVGTPAFTESYWVADAMAGYQINDNLDLQLNLYNLADTNYVAAINKSGYRYTPGQPRSGVLAVNLKF